jgi:hypothetical protein
MNRLILAGLCLLCSTFSLANPASDLRDKAMNPKLTVPERVKAIKALYPDMLVNGEIPRRRICIWDIGGRSGPIFAAAQDQMPKMLEYGIEVDMEAYTSESILSEDFKAGKCDAALMTGLKARTFNKFSGTIDAVGALPSLSHVKVLLRAVSNPKMAKYLEHGDYTVLGVSPAGAAYIFVNDKKVNSLTKAAGKRIVVLDYDPVQTKMVLQLGANPVPSDIVSAPNKFNNGAVDILPAPLVAYEFLELYRGMEPDGGIIDYPFSQATMQMIGHKNKFPTEIAQLLREQFYAGFDETVKRIEAETNVPDKWWIPIPDEDKRNYEVMMQDARIELREQDYYHPKMLTLARKVRCKLDPSRFECPNPKE